MAKKAEMMIVADNCVDARRLKEAETEFRRKMDKVRPFSKPKATVVDTLPEKWSFYN